MRAKLPGLMRRVGEHCATDPAAQQAAAMLLKCAHLFIDWALAMRAQDVDKAADIVREVDALKESPPLHRACSIVEQHCATNERTRRAADVLMGITVLFVQLQTASRRGDSDTLAALVRDTMTTFP